MTPIAPIACRSCGRWLQATTPGIQQPCPFCGHPGQYVAPGLLRAPARPTQRQPHPLGDGVTGMTLRFVVGVNNVLLVVMVWAAVLLVLFIVGVVVYATVAGG